MDTLVRGGLSNGTALEQAAGSKEAMNTQYNTTRSPWEQPWHPHEEEDSPSVSFSCLLC